jgi:hypothetical protein
MEKSNQMCLAQEVWLRAWTAAVTRVTHESMFRSTDANAIADRCLEEFSKRWSMTPEQEGDRADR